MAEKRKIEIFSAGCPVCDETVESVRRESCSSCEIVVLDMKEPGVVNRARSLGIRSLPAVVINGKLLECCAGQGPNMEILKAQGLGEPL